MRALPADSAPELASEIERAAPDQPYGVELRLDRPASIGALRTVFAQLGIARALAHVEYAHVGGGPRGIAVLGLGEMYASETARHYWECQALVGVGYTENELRHLPIDEWPVTEFNVYATAHAIRELLSGRLLPPATITSGGAGRPQDGQILENAVESELRQPIFKPASMDLPGYCSAFIGTVDAPILSRDFPRAFQNPGLLPGEDFRQHAFRALGMLPKDTAVNIDLKLNFPANVDVLASLVREYGIDGLRADLVPAQSSKRVLAEAQLSVHGGDLNAQVHRARCQMRLGGEEPQASSEWYADWVSVSLRTESAVQFLSYPKIAQANVTGAHPAAELDRLKSYFEKFTTAVYEIPKPIEIPSGCEHLYIHNDQEEVGSVRGAPPEWRD